MPPAGLDPRDLPPDLTAFWFGDYLPWARDLAHRLQLAQRRCAQATTPNP